MSDLEDMLRDLRDFAVVVLVVLGPPLLLIFGGCALASRAECRNNAALLGYKSSWGLFQDCMVKTPKGWWPYSQEVTRTKVEIQ